MTDETTTTAGESAVSAVDENAPTSLSTPSAEPTADSSLVHVVTGTVEEPGSAAAGDLPPAPDELALLNALKQVVDPELFVNVVDLGLVYAVQEEDHKVTVDMTLTSPACPAGPQIISQAKQALEALPGVKEATIKLVMTPPWSPDRMTDEARDQLGIF